MNGTFAKWFEEECNTYVMEVKILGLEKIIAVGETEEECKENLTELVQQALDTQTRITQALFNARNYLEKVEVAQ